jgi:DNA recombination protein Rad52
MGFSDRQIRALQRRVGAPHIKTRVSDGKELSYVEGWFAIAEANRIFGFDGWDRETVEAKCIQAREARGSFSVLYTTRVRVTVRSDERSVVRDGCGTGEGHGSHLGEAHDLALKAAETDATKRALVTFGKAFGLALYAGARDKIRKERQQGRQPMAAGSSVDALRTDQPIGRAILQAQVSAAQVAEQGVSPSQTPAIPRLPRLEDVGALGDSETGTSSSDTVSEAPSGENHESTVAPSLPAALRATELRMPVDKSALSFGEPRRVRNKEHLRHVAAQPCLLCGALPADAHHLRFAQPKAFGRKVSDEFTVPLCRAHHRELHHTGNERAWWHDMGVDPLHVAQRLWGESRGGSGDPGQTSQATPVEIWDLPIAETKADQLGSIVGQSDGD